MFNDTNFKTAIQAWTKGNPACDIGFENDRKGNPHLYSHCNCSSIKPVQSSGYLIEPYTFYPKNGSVFIADYPTSSPFVTLVSATQFTWNGNHVSGEISASISTGAKITTGGGFSTFQPQPSYQTAAVRSYLSSNVTLPPSFSYNTSFRAYPDISFNGHNFLIVVSNNTVNPDQCPCTTLPVDGTSASSPSLAGLLSLINDQLLAAGKPSLGFVNPALYQLHASSPDSFNDITSGNNRCNRAYCCDYGWETSHGWDPVTGLGTPVFPAWEKYFLGIKGVLKS